MGVLCVFRVPMFGGREGIVRVSAEKVEGVAGFVDEEGQVAVDAFEHCNVAGPVVGASKVGGCKMS